MNEINSPFWNIPIISGRGQGGVGSGDSVVINTALCSFGMSGLVFHAPFIQAHPGFNLYAVWERSQKSASKYYQKIRSFDSLEEMLADEAIDLVIVNTPNYTHFDFTKAALLAGKHVLVEKAFTVTVAEARELIMLANKMNRQIAVFQNRRYDSDFKTFKKVIQEGTLGKLVEGEIHFDRYKPLLSPKKHKESDIAGSGLLHDLGPHIIDQAICLFGLPESLFGFIRTCRPGSIVNDHFDIMFFYPELSMRLKAGLMVKDIGPSYIVHGSNGSFIKERADVQEDELKLGKKPGNADWGTEPPAARGILTIDKEGKTNSTIIESEQGNYMEFYDGLYNAIMHREALPVSAEDGLLVMRIIEAVLRSNEDKKIVSIS